MARIDGTSGSWQTIVTMLAEIGLQVEAPEDIAPLLTEHRNQLAIKTAEAGQKARKQLKPIEEEIQIEKENLQNGPAGRLADLEEDIRQARLHLELFRLDQSLAGRIRNLYRIRREEKRLQRLEANRAEITGRLEQLRADAERRRCPATGTSVQAAYEAERPWLASIPWEARLPLPGGLLVVVHGHRVPAADRHARLRALYPQARAIVYGHSHRLVVDRDASPWVLNPGAAGRAVHQRSERAVGVGSMPSPHLATDLSLYRATLGGERARQLIDRVFAIERVTDATGTTAFTPSTMKRSR